MRLSRCPAVIMIDVFVVRDLSCSLVSTARPLITSSVPSYNSGSTLWFVLFVWTYRCFCIAVLVSWYYSSTPCDAKGIRFHRLRLLARLDVCKGPWSLRGAEGNGNGARFVGAFLAGLAATTAAAVQNDGFRGRHHPSSYGRDAGEAYARVSFKPERAFNVIAHVRDWEHAETVRHRCLRTVRGFVL